MAERRVGVTVGTGVYIGARDAYEQGDAGDRQIQRFDFSSLQLPTTFYSSPNRSAVAVADGVDLSALSSTDITIGDKSVLIIEVDFNTAGANCVIVPVFYDSAVTPQIIGIGPEISFSAMQWRRTAAGNYFGEIKMIDTNGAAKVKLAIKSISAGAIYVYGGVA